VYSKIETRQSVEEIEHPAVRESLKFLNIARGIAIHHEGDLPARSGMGSSSSFTVGLLHALYALQGYMPSKTQLAKEAIHVEQDLLRETVGAQDQVLAAQGGFNHITFGRDGEFSVRPMTLPAERLEELNNHLMLFYTGIERTASDIAGSYVPGIKCRESQLRVIIDMVDQGMSVLNSKQDITRFGELLHEAWSAKSEMSSIVSNPHIDEIYGRSKTAGAVGGKLLGAGGGGFMLLFVRPEQQPRVKEELNRLLHVPFRFESSGSQIIFHDLEEDYSAEDDVRGSQSVDAFHEYAARDV
jgi:D-glycero-alpha-D-manno-heptose-7-phosphate kinase